jgi:hypothetical protein
MKKRFNVLSGQMPNRRKREYQQQVMTAVNMENSGFNADRECLRYVSKNGTVQPVVLPPFSGW